MADSLSAECTPLKRDYDGCFNSWFEGYLAVASPMKPHADEPARLAALKASAADYEKRCGSLWTSYNACLHRGIEERGIGELLQQSRDDEPLRNPAERTFPGDE